jgi:hypothetical protein
VKNLSLSFTLDRDEMRGHDAAHSVSGTVHIEGDEVVIRFTMHYATVGGAQVEPGADVVSERLSEAFDRDVAAHSEIVRIPFDRIDTVKMSGGVMRSPRLVLGVVDEAALAGLPWSDGCSCMMRLRRADGQKLRRWIVEAELRLAKARTRAPD